MLEEELKRLRKLMRTEASDPELQTRFFRGVEGISVDLIDSPKNPYKAIFDLATATWGDEIYEEKFEKTSKEGRKMVLEAALTHQTLPSCLEAPKFTWRVQRVSRSSFDQIARVRIGAAIGSLGVRDNNRSDAGFRIPADLYGNEEIREAIEKHVREGKLLYHKLITKERSSWQSARCILPMGMTHHFYITMNYLSFQQQCAKRLAFCEQPDTVAAFWLMRKELGTLFPVLAAYCRPACDLAKKCVYHQQYSLSELFSCLFRSCGRWPVTYRKSSYFDYPSCTREEIEKDLGIEIPTPEGWEELTRKAWQEDRLLSQ